MAAYSNPLSRRGNDALRVNPPNADLSLVRWGSSWSWAVFAIMASSLIGVLGWSLMHSRRSRAFHHIAAAILATSSLAWFSMASGLGAVPILVEFLRNSPPGTGILGLPTRQIFYARYIDWAITVPLLLLLLLLMTPMPLSTLFIVMFFSVLMIVCGLIGALVRTSYKWGYFTMGCVALLYILYTLFGPALRGSGRYGKGYRRAYVGGASYLGFLWLLYPICWAISDGGNMIRVSSEMVFFGILDILTKPIFLLTMLYLLSKLDYEAMGLRSGKTTKAFDDNYPAGDTRTDLDAGGTPAGREAGAGGGTAGGAPAGTAHPAAPAEQARQGQGEKFVETGGGAMPAPAVVDTSRPTQ